MKIAIYVPGAKCADTSISAHAQIPLKTADLLQKQGHKVTLITTEPPPSYQIPPVISSAKVDIKTITPIETHLIDLLKAPVHFYGLKSTLRQEHYDILHFFGGNKTAYLLGLIKASGIRTRALMTFINYCRPQNMTQSFIERNLFPYIDHSIALTNYTKERLTESGFGPVSMTPPGVLERFHRDQGCSMKIRPEATDLVLFWRSSTFDNGVDVCIEVFEILSREFELVDFVFAVRCAHQFKEQFSEMVKQHRNIHLLIGPPYKDSVTISRLLDSASCVVLPFRKLSANPQLAVLETLLAGAPLVTTPVESNKELIEDHTAVCYVEPSNIQQTYSAVKYLLENKAKAREMGNKAKLQAAKRWNWQVYEEKLVHVYKRFI